MPWNNLNPQQNWQSLGGGGLYGSFNYGDGGIPVARSDLDQMRIGIGRTPQAEYPDGYLGQFRSRRDDKGKPNSVSEAVLESAQSRVTQRSYQRGVHKGARIDPGDYVWSKQWSNETGIENQLKGRKTKLMNPNVAPTHLVNDGKADIPNHVPGTIDPRRAEKFARLRPRWV